MLSWKTEQISESYFVQNPPDQSIFIFCMALLSYKGTLDYIKSHTSGGANTIKLQCKRPLSVKFLFKKQIFFLISHTKTYNPPPNSQVAPPPASATLNFSLFEYLEIYIHKFEKYLVDSDEITLMDQVKTQKRPVEICLVNLRSLIPYWQMTTQNGRLKMAAYCIDLYRTVRVVRFLFIFYILH